MGKYFFKILGLLVFIASVVLSWFWMGYQQFLKTPLAINKPVVFEIKPGDSLDRVVNQFYQQGLLPTPLYFRLYNRLEHRHTTIQAGEYLLPPDYRPAQIIKLFASGTVRQHKLTIVEGWTLRQILHYLQHTNLVQPDQDLLTQLQAMRVRFQGKTYPLEGFIFPETYYYVKGTRVVDILHRAINRMKKILLHEWAQRDKKIPLNNAYEALILASIVEKETGVKSEYAKIAGVFARRLQKGMKLQSDPTIIYGMGERYQGNIRKQDITQRTAYNTYQIKGLPPTPIASPGLGAIHAVLHPQAGKALYFVANGSGGHYFSRSLQEHNRAVKKYLSRKR